MNDYDRTIQAIKDLDALPSKTEWNSIAYQYGFLTTPTLARISGKSFFDLCKEIRKK